MPPFQHRRSVPGNAQSSCPTGQVMVIGATRKLRAESGALPAGTVDGDSLHS